MDESHLLLFLKVLHVLIIFFFWEEPSSWLYFSYFITFFHKRLRSQLGRWIKSIFIKHIFFLYLKIKRNEMLFNFFNLSMINLKILNLSIYNIFHFAKRETNKYDRVAEYQHFKVSKLNGALIRWTRVGGYRRLAKTVNSTQATYHRKRIWVLCIEKIAIHLGRCKSNNGESTWVEIQALEISVLDTNYP